ncbi:MAG: MCP four helix bundle domain-containing protein, partial [Oscillospiraceae bacterium]|nr:MCP four helix bundle domain-containing protein [Oscillospiraceae bacterium]
MRTKRISVISWGGIAVSVIAVIFTVLSLFLFSRLNNRITSLYNDTYQVNGEVRAFAARLNEIDLALPTILENDNTNRTEHIFNILDERYSYQDSSYEIIKEHYLGDQQDIEDFRTAMIKMREHRKTAVIELAEEHDISEIMHYYDENVMIYSNAIHEILRRIENGTNARAEAIVESAHVTWNTAP